MKKFIGIIVILLVCLIPRLLLLSNDPFHYDSADMLVEMRNGCLSDHGLFVLLPSVFLIGIAKILKFFSYSQTSDLTSFLLILTAILSAFSCLLIYLLFGKIKGERFAAVYALLFSFAPNLFSVSTFGRIDHILAVIFLTLFLYYLLKEDWVWSAFFLGLAFLARVECLLFMPAAIIFVLFNTSRKKVFKTGIFLLVSIALPVIFIMLFTGGKRFFDGVILSEIRGMFTSTIDKANSFLGVLKVLLEHIFTKGWLLIKISGLPFFLAFFGVFSMWKKRERKRLLFFLVAFLVFFIFVSTRANQTVRNLISGLFFLFFLSAEGIFFIGRTTVITAVLTLGCILTMILPHIPKFHDRHKVSYQRDYVRSIQNRVEPDSIIITQDQAVFFDYYTTLEVLHPPVDCDKAKWRQFVVRLFFLLRSGRPVYIIPSAFAYDDCLYLYNIINTYFLTELMGSYVTEGWHDELLNRRVSEGKLLKLIPDENLRIVLDGHR